MLSSLNLHFHQSQFPDQVAADLVHSLQHRQMAHKFHYDSPRQSRKWLKIHEQFSPARTDPSCLDLYDLAFQQVAQRLTGSSMQWISLGCGGGQKDAAFCRQLHRTGFNPDYWPMDVSPALVLISWLTVAGPTRRTIGTSLPAGFVGDLASVLDPIPELRKVVGEDQNRLITFFGMMPNFEPDQVLPRLGALLRQEDWLLVSANLAPGTHYGNGVQKVLPLYENRLTAEWLCMILEDLGLEGDAGRLVWSVKPCPVVAGLLRIQADYHFDRPQTLHAGRQAFAFEPGDFIQLFYSYRHTSENLPHLLARYGMEPVESWVTESGEEGVFLCRSQ